MLTQGDLGPLTPQPRRSREAAVLQGQGRGSRHCGRSGCASSSGGLASGIRLRRRGSRGEGAEVVESLGEVGVQVLCGVVDPGLERLVEGGPAGLGGQAGQAAGDAALA
jgi:hypothetical protein